MNSMDTGPENTYAVDALRHKRVVHTTYVCARDRAHARDLGYRAHLMLGIRRRHGPIRCEVRGASCWELGMVEV